MSLIRLALSSSLVLALTACGGGGLGGNLGGVLGGLNPVAGTMECTTGTQVELANPLPGQTGVPGNIGQITIVADGSNNTLYNTYDQWNLRLTDQYGDTVYSTSNLTLVSDTNGPHPYTSDFYYAAGVGQLPSGSTWSVYLNEPNANCAAVPLNSFST